MAIELITAGTQVIATIKVTPAKENGVGSITNLSRRGQKALIRPPLLKCALFDSQYTPNTLEAGIINLGVAENSLMTDWLIAYYEKNFSLTYTDFTYGTSLAGSHRLFSALELLTTNYFNSKIPVKRSDVCAGSGCGSVIDLLVSCLADAGEGILISKPFYNGFAASFECRSGIVAIGVDLEEGFENSIDALEAYERALIESEARGIKVRAIMICNPHNPLGFCYSKETLIAYMKFAQKNKIHLISDEIYALSTFESDLPNAEKFTSILSLSPTEFGVDHSRIHIIYGASKDWGANGFRLGALISQANPELHTAMQSSCLLMKVSSVSDALWSNLLMNPVELPNYIQLNQESLKNAYVIATSWLNLNNIPFRPSNAGHFIMIDLRRFLPIGHDIEEELKLSDQFNACGVNLARGGAYLYPVAGWFRMTFTIRKDFFELGLRRIEKALNL